jgi:hypothetical protein
MAAKHALSEAIELTEVKTAQPRAFARAYTVAGLAPEKFLDQNDVDLDELLRHEAAHTEVSEKFEQSTSDETRSIDVEGDDDYDEEDLDEFMRTLKEQSTLRTTDKVCCFIKLLQYPLTSIN